MHLCPSPEDLSTALPTHEGATVSPGMLAGWRSHTPPPEFLVLQGLWWDLKFYIFNRVRYGPHMKESVGLQGIIDGIVSPLPPPVDSLNLGGAVPCAPPSTQEVLQGGALLLSLFKRGGRSGWVVTGLLKVARQLVAEAPVGLALTTSPQPSG